jgi:transcriptional regulator with XRE-family HTH domain
VPATWAIRPREAPNVNLADMPGTKRTQSEIAGAARASSVAGAAGAEVKRSRVRRRLTQKALASRVGISRSRLADIEAGHGSGAPLTIWHSLAEALGRPFRAEFLRDRLEAPPDAGHLDMQQLLVRLGGATGYDRRLELPWRSGDATRWTDVALVNRTARQLILHECVNKFGDIGATFRSSDRKLDDATQLAVAMAGDGPPFGVGLCWVIRDTARNRELLRRYEDLFATRLPGSSRDWVRALTDGGPFPAQPGLVWCDLGATRLFAWRRRGERVRQ